MQRKMLWIVNSPVVLLPLTKDNLELSSYDLLPPPLQQRPILPSNSMDISTFGRIRKEGRRWP